MSAWRLRRPSLGETRVLGIMEEAMLMDYRHQPTVDYELDELRKDLKQGNRSEL